ncbi:hypothetical protein [Kitasatospora sp. NPDC101183]|uniref:hypothetical protein n=1 Tax=Kitasatospora sp. NPDC101183 TaxID=3364100 RepID=UPI0037F28A79
MDIVHASLRRRPGGTAEANEAAQAVDALWAHAEPGDGLQHAYAEPADDRIDLLLYLLGRDPSDRPDRPDAVRRAYGLIARSHRSSPALHRGYLPPRPPQAKDRTAG